MQATQQKSQLALVTEQLGQLTVEERRQKNTKEKLQAVWDYLDVENKKSITCEYLGRFLKMSGVCADENYVYEMVCNHRLSKLGKNDYFEKPLLAKVEIAYPEFEELMTRFGHKKSTISQLKAQFAELQRITPRMNYEGGGIRTDELFRQMKLWDIMSDDEIEMTRVFFGYNSRACDIMVIDKYFEKLETDFM